MMRRYIMPRLLSSKFEAKLNYSRRYIANAIVCNDSSTDLNRQSIFMSLNVKLSCCRAVLVGRVFALESFLKCKLFQFLPWLTFLHHSHYFENVPQCVLNTKLNICLFELIA